MAVIDDGTITAQIELGLDKNIRGGKLFLQGKTEAVRPGHVVYNRYSVIDNYMDILKQHWETITMSEEQLNIYRYNPRLFCYDFYGSVDWWQLLLRVNNMHSPIDFTKKRIITFKDTFYDAVMEILAIEDDRLERNHMEMEEP